MSSNSTKSKEKGYFAVILSQVWYNSIITFAGPQMQEFITFFTSKKTTTKIAYSPYDDNTFVFENRVATNNREMFTALVSYFILNVPLAKLSGSTRALRRKAELNQYYNNTISYFILDVDDVKSEFDKQQILLYFKDFKVIIGESRSHNGEDNFRMKGILFTEEIELKDAKSALSIINQDLKEFCNIDLSVVRKGTFNAPIFKNIIFLNNEDGMLFKYVKPDAISHINKIKSEYIGTCAEIDIKDLAELKADTMENLCIKVFKNLGFTAIKNNTNGSISFKHPSEIKTPGGFFWFSSSPYTMHHGNSSRSINIFDSVRKLDVAKQLMKKEIDYKGEFSQSNTITQVVQVNEQYLEVSPEIKTTVESYLGNKNGLLSIRSPMGTGKSTIINYIIQECHEQDMKVLIVTNRISVAQDFGKKYNMKVYNTDKYELGDSLVCQYDSLWRYNIKFFDIVIMDEFVSLMLHSRSNLNNSSINIAKFFGCFNKKLVIADAFLTGYENFLLSNKKTNLHLIDNIYRDDTILYQYENFNNFIQSIIIHADAGKITISGTSLSFINSVAMMLTKRGKNVLTLTASTLESTKKLVYELFEKDTHDKWDILIFSPTLTVGVSNLNDIKHHFHFDSAMSSDAISSIQMIKRTRKAQEIHLYIKERTNYVKTSFNEIRDEYMGNIGRNIEHNYLFDIDNYGEAKLSDIGKKAIKIDTFKNILDFNHKAVMLWLLKYHFSAEPVVITDTQEANPLAQYQKDLLVNNKKLLLNNVNQFLQLNDIEKTSLLLDSDADKTLRALAEIDDNIGDVSPQVKAKILECALEDRGFLQKCRYYKVTYLFNKKIWDDMDVKNLVSKAVISGQNDDLHFYNMLLVYGQKDIQDSYDLKYINKNKHLRYILDKCGYKHLRGMFKGIIGHRPYCVDKKVKEYYHHLK